MNKSLMRAAKMLAGVRMLRCAMMLALLCSLSAEAEAQAEYLTITCSKCGKTDSYRKTNSVREVGVIVNTYYGDLPSCTGSGFLHYNCKKCGYVVDYISGIGHDWGTPWGNINPTCTTAGGRQHTCKRCGFTECDNSAPALGHNWNPWVAEDTPATCTTPGGRYRTCGRCNTIEYEQPALRHDMSGWKTVAATCTTGGYEHNYCRRDGCGYKETRNQTAALGHDFALDHNCTRCDAVDPAKQPTGCLDNCAGGELQISLNGWAYDPNVPSTPIDMHVYVYQNDGTTRYGDIHIINANLQRPDLATALSIPTNHGYSTTIPIADAGTYKVKVYAIDLNGDGNPQIGETKTVTVTGVPYIAANGQAQNCNSATRLTGGEATTLSSGWYYVTGEVNYTGCLTLDGDVTLILCDGATLNIGSNSSRLASNCINGSDHTLTVYGQGEQTGALYCYNRTSERKDKFGNFQGYKANSTALMSQFTLYGGNVTFDLNIHNSAVNSLLPQTVTANVDFRGGQLTVNGGYGIKGNVNINWSDPDDRFRTSGFGPNGTGGTVTIASGKAFTDDTNYYAGTLDNTTKVSTQGRTLWPVTAISLSDNASNSTAVTKLNGVNNLDVTLSDRTLYKDGAWNTLCLPFAVSTTSAPLSGDGVQAMTLDAATSGFANGTLTLNFNAAPTTIPAGTPFIIKWNDMGTTIEEPEFTGVTINNSASTEVPFTSGSFKGSFSPVSFTANDKSILFLGAENKLYYPTADMNINSCRAYFQLNDGSNVKEFKLNFGEDEETHLLSPEGKDIATSPRGGLEGVIYDLSGRKIANGQKPIANGLYIVNGKKIIK